MAKKFDVKLKTDCYIIKINTAEQFGYFESRTKGNPSSGCALFFENKVLVQYIGVQNIPEEVATALQNAEYDADFFPDD